MLGTLQKSSVHVPCRIIIAATPYTILTVLMRALQEAYPFGPFPGKSLTSNQKTSPRRWSRAGLPVAVQIIPAKCGRWTARASQDIAGGNLRRHKTWTQG